MDTKFDGSLCRDISVQTSSGGPADTDIHCHRQGSDAKNSTVATKCMDLNPADSFSLSHSYLCPDRPPKDLHIFVRLRLERNKSCGYYEVVLNWSSHNYVTFRLTNHFQHLHLGIGTHRQTGRHNNNIFPTVPVGYIGCALSLKLNGNLPHGHSYSSTSVLCY